MGIVVLIGRILYAAVFFGSGIGQLTQTRDFVAYAETRGVPRARPLVIVSGGLILVGSLSLILGVWADAAALGLALFTLSTAFVVHHPWTDDGDVRQMEFTNFMKDLALAGAGLALWVLISNAGADLPFTITGPLFDLSL